MIVISTMCSITYDTKVRRTRSKIIEAKGFKE